MSEASSSLEAIPAYQQVTVIGGGAWGTALAMTAGRAGRQVRIWVRETEVVEAINDRHENPVFLPGVALDPALKAHQSLADAVAGTEVVLLVVPSQHLRRMVKELAPLLPQHVAVVVCSKGVEENGALMSEVIAEELPDHILAVLSGPSFAAEVAHNLPTAVTIATEDAARVATQAQHSVAAKLIATMGTLTFRPYLSDDVVGAEVGGAVKNVLAIACGIAHGRQLGSNARAALITRGLAEIARLSIAKGGRHDTVMGLAGMGDLTLTCSSEQSRNMSFGTGLGQGKTMDELLSGKRAVVEGIPNAATVSALAKRLGLDMPICAVVDAILHHGADIDTAINGLLDRPFRAETPHLDDISLHRPTEGG